MSRPFWKRCLAMGPLLAILSMAGPAHAYDWAAEVNVATIETTYVPSGLQFTINSAAGTCASGTWLRWNTRGSDEAAQIANIQAVLSTLLTAKMAGTKIRIYGNNNGCTIDFIHLI